MGSDLNATRQKTSRSTLSTGLAAGWYRSLRFTFRSLLLRAHASPVRFPIGEAVSKDEIFRLKVAHLLQTGTIRARQTGVNNHVLAVVLHLLNSYGAAFGRHGL